MSKPYVEYECTCHCHGSMGKVVHFVACCSQCDRCGRNIMAGMMDMHLDVCWMNEDKKDDA